MNEYTAVFGDWLNAFRDWLSIADSGSTTIRNLVLAAVAVVALPLAIWRSRIAQEALLNGRYQKGAEMLGSDLLSVRLGGLYALDHLAEEHPKQYHLRNMHLFCAFVRHPSWNACDAIAPASEEPSTPDAQYDIGFQGGGSEHYKQPRVREDVQALMDLLRERSAKRIALEQKSGFEPDLRGACLRHANLARTNLDRAVFASADLSYASLNGVSLKKANLGDTKLFGAMLAGAILSEADLAGAALAGADLSGAILCNTNLCNTNLSGTRFHDPDSGKRVRGLTQGQLDAARAGSNDPPCLAGATDAETGSPLTWCNRELSSPRCP